MAQPYLFVKEMTPIDNLYAEIKRLPLRLLDSTRSAVIVPAFFLKREKILASCNTIMSCARL